MRYFVLRFLLGVFFCQAGLAKLANPVAFREALQAYPWGTPSHWDLVARFLPWLETFSGINLALGLLWRSSLWILTVLLVGFNAIGAYLLLVGWNGDCACFGDSSGPFGLGHVALNGSLLGLCIVLLRRSG